VASKSKVHPKKSIRKRGGVCWPVYSPIWDKDQKLEIKKYSQQIAELLNLERGKEEMVLVTSKGKEKGELYRGSEPVRRTNFQEPDGKELPVGSRKRGCYSERGLSGRKNSRPNLTKKEKKHTRA